MRRRGAATAAIPLWIAVMTLAGVATWTSGPKFANKWDEAHDARARLSGRRPECPQHWGTVPVFFVDSLERRRFELPPRRGARDAGFLTEAGEVLFTAGATWSASVPSGPIANVAGPITNIPEFHDCQKFVNGAQTAFDSLFAIFASFRLDSIVDSLKRDSVTWSSSDASKATVSPLGKVTAVAAGIAAITATSTIESDRKVSVTVVVSSDPPVPTGDTVSTSLPGAITLGVGQSVTVVAEIGTPTVATHAVAAIYSYGLGYPDLGIGPNFNCMYLYFDSKGSLRAKVYPVADLDQAVDACFRARNPNTDPGGKDLRVIRVPGKTGAHAPVARWDWDARYNRQYIGIECGNAWCEIGRRDSPFEPSQSYDAAPGVPLAAAQVIENKGWYDEQNLAMPGPVADPARPRKKRPVPSGLKGTLIPDPALALQTQTTFSNGWVPVAYIALDTANVQPGALLHYRELLNLRLAPHRGDLGSLNRLEFCFGTRAHCGVPPPTPGLSRKCSPEKAFFWFQNNVIGWAIERMWVKITPAGAQPDDKPLYRCAIRRGHDGYNANIPETARWRWVLDDDTTWAECTQGCCETRISDN